MYMIFSLSGNQCFVGRVSCVVCVWKMRTVISIMISFTLDDPIFRLARPQRVQGTVSEVAQPLHLHNL